MVVDLLAHQAVCFIALIKCSLKVMVYHTLVVLLLLLLLPSYGGTGSWWCKLTTLQEEC
jgi:hypothetical protein